MIKSSSGPRKWQRKWTNSFLRMLINWRSPRSWKCLSRREWGIWAQVKSWSFKIRRIKRIKTWSSLKMKSKLFTTGSKLKTWSLSFSPLKGRRPREEETHNRFTRPHQGKLERKTKSQFITSNRTRRNRCRKLAFTRSKLIRDQMTVELPRTSWTLICLQRQFSKEMSLRIGSHQTWGIMRPLEMALQQKDQTLWKARRWWIHLFRIDTLKNMRSKTWLRGALRRGRSSAASRIRWTKTKLRLPAFSLSQGCSHCHWRRITNCNRTQITKTW